MVDGLDFVDAIMIAVPKFEVYLNWFFVKKIGVLVFLAQGVIDPVLKHNLLNVVLILNRGV